MEPAALLSGGREDLAHRFPEPQRAIPDGQYRGGHAATTAVAQQISPRLGRLAVAISDRDQFLASVGTHAQHHQQAQFLLLQPDLEMDPVDPRYT